MPANYNPDVQIKVEIGFDSTGPYDTTFTWTDVSKYVRSFDYQRGRQFEIGPVMAGTADIELSNTDRRFDPDSTGGAYSPDVEVMKPVRLQAIHDGTTYDLFRGYAAGWAQTYPGMTDAVTTLRVVDGFKPLAYWEVASTSPQELSGTRAGRLLTNAEWPSTMRALDVGDVTCDEYTPDCSFALSELQRVQDTEEGVFFMAGNGDATFHDNSHRTGSTSIATFTDTGGGMNYTEPLTITRTDVHVWNDVTVAGVNTTPQAADSTASVDLYGRRKLRRFDTLHHNATSALDAAQVIRDRYKDPATRIPSISFLPGPPTTALWPQVLGREISDRITIRRATRSATTGVYSGDHHIEGIRTVATVNKDWRTEWLLSPST